MTPLTMMMRAPTVLVVPPNSPYKTLADPIGAAKAQPGKFNYAAGSAGYQLMLEALNDSAHLDIRNVPFKGASEALIAIASGSVDMAACIAARHPKWDERPLLIVVKKPGAELTRDELLAFYDGKIAK